VKALISEAAAKEELGMSEIVDRLPEFGTMKLMFKDKGETGEGIFPRRAIESVKRGITKFYELHVPLGDNPLAKYQGPATIRASQVASLKEAVKLALGADSYEGTEITLLDLPVIWYAIHHAPRDMKLTFMWLFCSREMAKRLKAVQHDVIEKNFVEFQGHFAELVYKPTWAHTELQIILIVLCLCRKQRQT
jgi:hypothetical protein